MPNYLALGQSVANAVTVGQDFDVSGQQLQNAGINAGVAAVTALSNGQDPFAAAVSSGVGSIPGASTITSAVGAVGSALGLPGLGGLGGGTKPMALHTEYASGSAQWAKPYGAGTDIVFYLERAGGGGGGPSSSESPLAPFSAQGVDTSFGGANSVGDFGSAMEAAKGADVATGLNLPDGMQSPLNQAATSFKLSGTGTGMFTNKGLAGPLTGFTKAVETSTGATSQVAALTTRVPDLVANAVNASATFPKTSTPSIPSSMKFFSELLSTSFNPTNPNEVGSLAFIEEALSSPSVAELSSQMATYTGGVTSTKAFIQGINHGLFGYSNAGSSAEAQRTGPQGLSQRQAK